MKFAHVSRSAAKIEMMTAIKKVELAKASAAETLIAVLGVDVADAILSQLTSEDVIESIAASADIWASTE